MKRKNVSNRAAKIELLLVMVLLQKDYLISIQKLESQLLLEMLKSSTVISKVGYLNGQSLFLLFK